MAAVPSVHEQMNHRAQQQEHLGQRAEHVRAMLLHRKKAAIARKRHSPSHAGMRQGSRWVIGSLAVDMVSS